MTKKWILLLPPILSQIACAESCPATIKVSATASQPLIGLSVLNGKNGGKEYDLVPDDERKQGKNTILTWNLKDYRSMNLFMRCRYRDTQATVSMDLPAALKTCTFTGEIDAKGNVVGTPSAGCK